MAKGQPSPNFRILDETRTALNDLILEVQRRSGMSITQNEALHYVLKFATDNLDQFGPATGLFERDLVVGDMVEVLRHPAESLVGASGEVVEVFTLVTTRMAKIHLNLADMNMTFAAQDLALLSTVEPAA